MARTGSGLRILPLAALALIGVAAVARAADAPLPGKLLLIKDGKLAKVIAKSTGTPFPLPARAMRTLPRSA